MRSLRISTLVLLVALALLPVSSVASPRGAPIPTGHWYDCTSTSTTVLTTVRADAKLQNYVKDLYKGTTNPSRVGNGTTADAVRAELATGQATAGKVHLQKAQDTARGLENWLGRNRGATPHDRRVAQSLYDELIDAMGPHR